MVLVNIVGSAALFPTAVMDFIGNVLFLPVVENIRYIGAWS
jgi:hypothetical protein